MHNDLPSLPLSTEASWTPAYRRTLSAAADRIVPTDTVAGAGQAGAAEYVRLLLDRDLPHRWPELIAGLDRLDAAAGPVRFVDLSADAQDAVLREQEGSPDPARRTFFAWLVELVLESYYADPANGGNADAVSWRMVGFDARRSDAAGRDGR